MIPIKSITITQAEGLISEALGKPVKHSSWTSAERHISNICRSAPASGGYFKCDFTIVWEDGSEYKGRYDAACPTSDAYEGSLSNHLVQFCQYAIGRGRKFFEDQSPDFPEWMEKMLTQYDLGESQPKGDPQ